MCFTCNITTSLSKTLSSASAFHVCGLITEFGQSPYNLEFEFLRHCSGQSLSYQKFKARSRIRLNWTPPVSYPTILITMNQGIQIKSNCYNLLSLLIYHYLTHSFVDYLWFHIPILLNLSKYAFHTWLIQRY